MNIRKFEHGVKRINCMPAAESALKQKGADDGCFFYIIHAFAGR